MIHPLHVLFPVLAGVLAPTPTAPQPIAGGQSVEACGWPSVPAVVRGNGACSSTLIHPQLILYAAHCGPSNRGIAFGDTVETAGRIVETERCTWNGAYSGGEDVPNDWAVCLLREPITDLPIVPIAMGCELDQVQIGAEVHMVGYGNPDPDVKTWTTGNISEIEDGELRVDVGACGGDSGGPGLLRMPDGSWRTIGIASWAWKPPGCQQVGQQIDGGYTRYSRTHNTIAWLENWSGLDVTPCHDPDGTWNPGPECGGFYAGEPGSAHGTWDDACMGTPASGLSETCGAAYDPDAPATTSGDGGTGEGETGDGDGSDGGDSGEDPGADEAADGGETTAPPSAEGSGTDGAAASDAGSDGCRSAGGPPAYMSIAVVLLANLQRRRRE